MSEEHLKNQINQVVNNLADQKNMVRISLKAKPDHIIEIMKLLEKLQNG